MGTGGGWMVVGRRLGSECLGRKGRLGMTECVGECVGEWMPGGEGGMGVRNGGGGVMGLASGGGMQELAEILILLTIDYRVG